MIFLLFLFIAIFIFLFVFYYYARDDYFFIRKGISMEQLFNILFLGLFWAAIAGRAVALLQQNSVSSLMSFVSPTTPGFSIVGAVVGMFLFYTINTKSKKIHAGRFLDYVSLGLLGGLPIYFFGEYLDSGKPTELIGLYLPIVFTVLLFFFNKVIFPKISRGSMVEGSLGQLFLILFSFVILIQDVIFLYTSEILLSLEDFFLVGLFFVSSALLIRTNLKKSQKIPKV